MKHFLTITNIQKDEKKSFTKEVKDYIEQKGGTCLCYYSSGNKERVEQIDPKQIPEGVECILVLGGDGTLIRAARDLYHWNIPMLGVNLGTLGYLCEVERSNIRAAIDEIMQEHYMIERRMMLEGYCVIDGKEQKSRAAFNDIIIHRGTNPSVKTLIIRVNGEYLNTYVGDGIIVATPSGSTAYNMSAGGPIVDPKAKLLLVTPINSHSLNAKSIVLSADDEIEIEISARNHETDDSAEVSFDGDYPSNLGFGDKIVIKKAEQATNILKLSKLSFLEILSKKMQTCILNLGGKEVKSERHAKILEIIRKNEVETQEELSDRLEREGFQVTQATVSRDIRELKLTKVAMSNGKQKYAALTEPAEDLSQKYIRVLKDGFASMDMAQNILVVRTVSGMAMAVAAALDALNFHEIVGTIAGDDTIMCAVRSVEENIRLMDRLRKMVGK